MKDELDYTNLEKYLYSAEPTENYEEKPRWSINKPFDDLFAEELLPTAFYFGDDEESD
jgi:hypothetical protein